jgi:hypothetical protein
MASSEASLEPANLVRGSEGSPYKMLDLMFCS